MTGAQLPDLPPEMHRAVEEHRNWLLTEARLIEDPETAVAGSAERIMAAGIPLDRMMSAMPTLIASRRGLGRYWDRENGMRTLDYPWDNQSVYEKSPFYEAHQTRHWVSFRVADIADDAYTIVPDLREQGYTHYVCIPVFFQDGTEGGLTFSTRHPDGFSDLNLAYLKTIEPAFATYLDLKRSQRLLRETLGMYVGREPRDRILSGTVRLGDVHPQRAAIVFADMKGFTSLSSTMTAVETVALLNRYFACVVPAIEAHGGEVLKYIGDGVLAVFYTHMDGSDADGDADRVASQRALAAVADVVAAVAQDRAGATDGQRFDVKLALHLGEVAFGNIGSGDRLDFTVVGRDVNLASRLADLAGALGRPIVTSQAAKACLSQVPHDELGAFPLKGLTQLEPVFAPHLPAISVEPLALP
ncbi:MAG: adenylate/guanylate cyclase domain-containing protein [Pseudomonadota bacterium]